MNSIFQQKNIIVGGGSKGIGLELVRQLVHAGANVDIYSRTSGELSSNQLSTSGRVKLHAFDFSDKESEMTDVPNEIHGAVYCPGTINLRSFRALNLDDFRQDLEINLMGAIKFLKSCMAGLKKGAGENPSSVVLFSTVAVGKGMAMHSSIAAAKGAVEGLTRSIAAEWAPQIRVNCIAPALTETPLTENFFTTSEKREAMAAKYPLKRTGQPGDIASMAKTLLGPETSWVTGQVIGVDGGLSTLGG